MERDKKAHVKRTLKIKKKTAKFDERKSLLASMEYTEWNMNCESKEWENERKKARFSTKRHKWFSGEI